MGKLLLGFPNYADASVQYAPSLSGGSWSSSLPLTNLQSRYLAAVARSINAQLTSTIVKADLGVARTVRMLGAPKHTMSSAADARWRLFAANPILEDNDFNSWTSAGTPTIATGQTDPFGGTRATLIGDDDAAVVESKSRTVTFTGNGVKSVALTIKQGTSSTTEFGIRDSTAVAWLHLVRATWSAGVPTLSTQQGSGTLYPVVSLGNGWYQVQFTTAAATAANTNTFYFYGVNSSSVANTGNTFAYEAMAFDFTTQPIVIDSGVIDAYPAGVTAEDVDGLNVPHVYVASAAASGRYVRWEIADTTNSAGYIDVARLWVSGAYEPTYNASYGAKLGLESDTTRSITDGGAAIYQAKPIRRSLNFALDNVVESEAFASPWKIQRLANKSGQMFVVFDQADTTLLHERSFLCVLRELSALEFSQALYNAVGFQLVEEL